MASRIRVGLRAKVALGVTLLTFFIVAILTLFQLSRLNGILIQEAVRQVELIQRQIFDQSRRSLAQDARNGIPETLRRDAQLRSLLDASIGYSPHLLYAMIADHSGNAILHSEEQKEGLDAPPQPGTDTLLSMGQVERFVTIYDGGTIYESSFPLSLNDQPFGTIRLGIHTSLLRKELLDAIADGLSSASIALLAAWLVAMGFATVTLKPLHGLIRRMERLRRGEFQPDAELNRADEIGELASQLQLLGRQLEADRLKMLSEKSRVQHMVDHLEDGIIYFNQDRMILFYNKTAEAVIGRPLEQAVGCSLNVILDPSHPFCRLVETSFNEKTAYRNTAMTLARGGISHQFLVSVFPVMEGPTAVGAVALLKDLESIKMFHSLIQYSAKLAALGRLTSGVAHEVKNPLNAMAIHLELLKEKLDLPSDEVRRTLEVIRCEIQKLDRIVQGFLKFVRPQELKLTRVDVNALLKNEVALLDVEWRSKGIMFDFYPDPALPFILADEELLRQAFVNILLNACHAMPGGGTVSILTEAGDGDVMKVHIGDEGVGIPHEDLDKIFKLYYTTKPDGNGIGLALAYRIVQMHDGVIEVISDVGRGTTMTTLLPLRSSHDVSYASSFGSAR